MSEKITLKLWEDKEKEIVNPYLFSDDALKRAREIYYYNPQTEGKDTEKQRKDTQQQKKEKRPEITQVRRFYDEILNIYNQLQSMKGDPDENFRKILPYFRMLKPFSYYSYGRNLVNKKFVDLIEECVNSVNDYKDFMVLKTFFEAFMGYYRYLTEKKKEKDNLL